MREVLPEFARLLIFCSVISTLVAGQHAQLSAREASSSSISIRRPLTVDDLLRQEDYGQALIDPTGRLLVFEQTPPYVELPDYGIDRSPGLRPTVAQIMVIDLTVAPTSPRRLFQPEPETEYRIQSFSPDGRRLLLYGVKKGTAHIVIVDIPNKRLKTFRGSPEIYTFSRSTAVWISSDEFVYAALSGGRQPVMISFRRYTGTRLFEAWNKTWKGRNPSVTEVASLADGGGKSFREGKLLRANARTGTTMLMDRGLFTDLKVSPDGNFVAGLRQGEAMQPSPDRLVDDVLDPFSQLRVFNMTARKSKLVKPQMDVDPSSLEWSSTSAKLAFFAWDKNGSSQRGLFHVYDTRTEQTEVWPHTKLNLATGSFNRPYRALWLDEELAVVAQLKAEGNINGAANTEVSAKMDWFLLNSSGETKNLTAEFKKVSPTSLGETAKGLCVLADGNVWRITSDGRKINLTDEVGGGWERVYYLDGSLLSSYAESVPLSRELPKSEFLLIDATNNGKVVTITPPSKTGKILAGSFRAGSALFRENTDQGIKLLLQRSNGATFQVSTINPYLGEIAKPEWKVISYRVSGGRKLDSGMFLPYGYVPGRRYPVVVDIYPSRASSTNPQHRMGEHLSFNTRELLASKGYIVFLVANPHDLNRTESGPIAGMSDIVSQGIDALISQGYADHDRICLFGFSQGGFSSLWLATESERFKAVVSINGWADMASHYFEGGIYRIFYSDELPFHGSSERYERIRGGDFNLGNTPWQDVKTYIRNSPVYRADRINTPILLVHSDMDKFALSQYEEMFTALYRLRKEARFVRYWGEGHGPSSPANIRDFWYRTFAWFDEWSDLSRDASGNLIWDGDKVKSRRGAASLKPGDFARFDRMILKSSK